MSRTLSVQIKSLSEQLTKKVSSSTAVDATQCIELLQSLNKITSTSSSSKSSSKSKSENKDAVTIEILNETKIGVCLNKLLKSFRRYKRSDETEEAKKSWEECITLGTKMLNDWKEMVKSQRESASTITSSASTSTSASATSSSSELPTSTANYRTRLITHSKEMYKDPPVLPPTSIIIESEYCPLPKRSKVNKELSFVLSDFQIKNGNGNDNDNGTKGKGKGKSSNESSKLQQYIKDFKPNVTPEEVLKAGSFGGTYFRPIISSVTNQQYNSLSVISNTLGSDFISNNKKTISMNMLSSSTYNKNINKFKVKCGGSLGMWESSGWISDSDPYGWFQWYCNFYNGRRCSDDERQISRWLKSAGPKGRFRSQLCNKIFAKGGGSGNSMKSLNDYSVSPVIRQTLLHWGLDITEDVLRKHGKRVGKL
jgi:hypothetical protein